MVIDSIITLWSALVVLFATTVHEITGFGTGQIAMGVLRFFRDEGSASIVISIVVFITNLSVIWSVRDEFNWKDWINPVAGLTADIHVNAWSKGLLQKGTVRLPRLGDITLQGKD